MALTDIDFNEGEGRDFLVELPAGTLNAPDDIVIEAGGSQYPVVEAPLVAGGGGDEIFILND